MDVATVLHGRTDHVATRLHADADDVATPLHGDADHVAAPLHIKTGNTLKTGNTRAKTGKNPTATDRMSTVIASDDGQPSHTTSVRLDALRAQQQKQQPKEPV